ncbi:MAG: DUF4296 domain-containing protein [Bacteroidota bacterium]
MKKTAFIILSAIALYSCGGPEKPKKLLSEKQMEDILYDVSLLQSINSFMPKVLDDNNVNSATYVFQKYKIDSITLAQNQVYYAHDLEGYKKMQQRIAARLKVEREVILGKKPGDKKEPEINTGSGLPSVESGTIPLSEEQKAKAQHRRDSVSATAKKRLKRVPAIQTPAN